MISCFLLVFLAIRRSRGSGGILWASSCGLLAPLCCQSSTRGTGWTASYKILPPNSTRRTLSCTAIQLWSEETCRSAFPLMSGQLDSILIINLPPFLRSQSPTTSKPLEYELNYLLLWSKCSKFWGRGGRYSYRKDTRTLLQVAVGVRSPYFIWYVHFFLGTSRGF